MSSIAINKEQAKMLASQYSIYGKDTIIAMMPDEVEELLKEAFTSQSTRKFRVVYRPLNGGLPRAEPNPKGEEADILAALVRGALRTFEGDWVWRIEEF